MKIEDIKQAMARQKEGELSLPKSMDHLKNSQLPITKVRKTMVTEIITQLMLVVIFFSFPFITEMQKEPQALYLILMFVVCTITLGYVLKMWRFYVCTEDLQCNSKDTIQTFIFNLKILLEVYKTAVVAGSVLLPVPMAAYILGSSEKTMQLYHQLFALEFTPLQLLLLALAYLLLAVIFYLMAVKWSDYLYGRQIKKLEDLLKQYEEVDEV